VPTRQLIGGEAMSRTASSMSFVALACGALCIAAVLFIVIPAYSALGSDPRPVVFFPKIAEGVQLSRAGWLVCGSSLAFAAAAVGFRRPSTPAGRSALATAIGGVALNAVVWIRYGSRMIWALSWTVGHESLIHWFR